MPNSRYCDDRRPPDETFFQENKTFDDLIRALPNVPDLPGDPCNTNLRDDIDLQDLQAITFTNNSWVARFSNWLFGERLSTKLFRRHDRLKLGERGLDLRGFDISSSIEDQDLTNNEAEKRLNTALFNFLYVRKKMASFYKSPEHCKEHMLDLLNQYYSLNSIDVTSLPPAVIQNDVYTASFCAAEKTKDFLLGNVVTTRPAWGFPVRSPLFRIAMVGGLAFLLWPRLKPLAVKAWTSNHQLIGSTLVSPTERLADAAKMLWLTAASHCPSMSQLSLPSCARVLITKLLDFAIATLSKLAFQLVIMRRSLTA
jgi:hypothetical protein